MTRRAFQVPAHHLEPEMMAGAGLGPYRDQRDAKGGLNSAGYWVCERDYQQFVSRHDLGFLLT